MGGRRGGGARPRGGAACAARPTPDHPPPHTVLGVPPDATAAEARAAWVALIRQAHPDVVSSSGGDAAEAAATARAAQLNSAYEAFRVGEAGGGGAGGSSSGGGWGAPASADPAAAAWPAPPAEPPTIPFVDPFAVGVDPFAWRELQALARGGGGSDGSASGGPEARLAAARLAVPPGGLAWLTPAQATEVESVLAGMEAFAYNPEFAAGVLADLLGRAAAVNGGGRPPAW